MARRPRVDASTVLAVACHAVVALLSALSVGLVLIVLGAVLASLGVPARGPDWEAFVIAASLVGGNLLAMAMDR